MLIRFNVENFLSFNEKVEFSLIANQERRLSSHFVKGRDINILKSAVVYGANASGKSNLIKAIEFSSKAILKGVQSINPDNCHYRLNKQNLQKPTVFNYEFKISEKYYSYGYGIQLNKAQIVEEWLFEIGKSKEVKIFERFINSDGIHEIEIGNGLRLTGKAKTRFDVYRDDFQKSDNLLFLSEINRKSIDDIPEAKAFTEVYEWFANKLVVLKPDSRFAGLNFVGDNEEMSDTFNKFMSVFQTGINKIVTDEVDFDSFDISKALRQNLIEKMNKTNVTIFQYKGIFYSLFKTSKSELKIRKIGLEHLSDKGEPVVFDIEEESDGTKRLFDLIPALHHLSKSDAVFIIDEVDRSLHSKLTYGLFDLFFKLTANNESQLIATTHESLLLDLNLLRRDEIWFIEKEKNSSRIYSLDQFQERSDKVVGKSYLLGRYGAIPVIKGLSNLI